MSEFLPKEVRDGLNQARVRAARRDKRRLRVQVGPEAYTIQSFGAEAFTLRADGAPHLRGLVDIYKGSEHLYQALIVTAALDGPEMRYEFKRMTRTRENVPLDYDPGPNVPAGLIARQ
ncbi:conserved hypothetical protein [Dinoroseobacter shibae DFL 12 = DSM 16493]|jgi:hypothetical protein|uniref:Uncharacterized protein n=1 Tax=Dinoroseobacter shibae (strain DSM 16493 / NCIMB 14021 / DFL 12) TaxID=398580 RepID=A8LLB6_DINSH|nr:hypothetical protein [Dinoroseobacter shibae]ABV91926.1 conserved hypothetical protein [Dinoroseobacter shibae DFL 12 = DSM 16493]URF46900.1 hypothetical protein M8008_00900 [Dinoroseobacter shibae]URF51211.1 hypothetical protein M8007_00900 [Dinoroseobacter shibae]